MKIDNIQVPARYYLRMADLLAQQGVPLHELLARAGISPRGLQEPDAQLRFSQVEALISVIFDEFHAPSDLTVDLGELLTITTHSIVGFGMLNSPNVEHSLQFIARFFRLVTPTFAMRYSKHDGGATIIWRPVVGMSHRALNFHIEAIACAAYRDIRELSRSLPRYRVEMSIEEPPHIHRYREMDGAQWTFHCLDKPGIRIRFDFDASQYPLDAADMNALRVAEARCRALQQSVAVRGSFKDWVLMMLRDAGNGQPSLSDLADVLNLSTRTLNRYLKNEGCNFRELAGNVQHDLARARLRDPRLSITEIALSLGFTETSNFSRFFSSKEGMSPRQYRQQQLQEAQFSVN